MRRRSLHKCDFRSGSSARDEHRTAPEVTEEGFEAMVFGSLLSDAEGGMAEELSCPLLPAKIDHSRGIKDYSSARKDLSRRSTFGPFEFV